MRRKKLEIGNVRSEPRLQNMPKEERCGVTATATMYRPLLSLWDECPIPGGLRRGDSTDETCGQLTPALTGRPAAYNIAPYDGSGRPRRDIEAVCLLTRAACRKSGNGVEDPPMGVSKVRIFSVFTARCSSGPGAQYASFRATVDT